MSTSTKEPWIPGDPGAAGLQASTLYIYGEDPHWDQAVNARGELRGVRRLLAWDPYDTVDRRFWYDDYGNVTEEVVYNSYGDAGSWASAQARSTTTAYDSLLHTFPVTVTNPLGHPVRTEYYGLNGPPLTAEGAFVGQASSVQDLANGLATAYHYDGFGRLTAVIRPGASAARPTLAYAYDDEGWPPSRATRQREEHDSDETLDAWQYYDGLGRPIQTQGEGQAAGHIILSDRRYDAAGRVEGSRCPTPRRPVEGTYRPPTWSEPYSAYAYDALGRSTEVTHPDRDDGSAGIRLRGGPRLDHAHLGRKRPPPGPFQRPLWPPGAGAGVVGGGRRPVPHHPLRVRPPGQPDRRVGCRGEPHPHGLRPPGPQDGHGRPGHGLLELRLQPRGHPGLPDGRQATDRHHLYLRRPGPPDGQGL